MIRAFLIFIASILLCGIVTATDITIGSTSLQGFNASIGSDVSISSVSVTNGSASVTCSTCLQPAWVGLSGFQVTLSGVVYTVASVSSRSAFTLTTTYAGSTATVSGTWHKYVLMRFYASVAFQPSGESYVVQPGGLGSANWFRVYAASVINNGSSNVLYIPEITLPATTNATPATARYTAAFYTVGGSFIQRFPSCIDDWRLDATTTPTSYATICTFNIPPTAPPPEPSAYYTTFQIDSRFPSCSSNQSTYYASTGNVQDCLTYSGDFSIVAGTLTFTGSSTGFINRIQEEGSNLTQRQTLNFVGSSATAADDSGNARTNVTFDSDLNSLASNTTPGLWAAVTGVGAGTARTLTAPAAGFTITNPAGTAGDPTFVLSDDLAAVEGLSTTGITARTATSTWAARTLTAPAAGFTITNPAGIAGDPTFVLADDLAALEGLSSSGIAARTGTSTWAVRTLTQPAAGFTITNPAGTGGDPTFVLANDLAAVEGISTTGMVARTASESWTTRTVTGTSGQVTVTNGTGVSGDPTISLPTTVFLGTAGGSPAAGTLTGPDASGTNIAGANLQFAPGKGTGTGVPGLPVMFYPLTTTTGSTLQSLSTNAFAFATQMFLHNNGDITVSNTTETSLVGSADYGSKDLENGLARTGRTFFIRLLGGMSVQAATTPTLQIQLKLGSTVVADTGAVTIVSGASTANGGFTIEAVVSLRSTGASASVACHSLKVEYTTTNGTTLNRFAQANIATVDLTATRTWDVTATWVGASTHSLTIFSSEIYMSR